MIIHSKRLNKAGNKRWLMKAPKKKGPTRIQLRETFWSISYGDDWDVQKSLAKARDGNKCKLCNHRPKRGDPPLHVHHIKSKSKGGSNKLSNLITVCVKCHKRQHKHMR